jgi:putative Holliday junction resolvase
MNTTGHILGVDIGEKRIGLAIAEQETRFPRPLTTVENTGPVFQTIEQICHENNVSQLVCGLPRGLDGQDTAQTVYARDFAKELGDALHLPIYLVDEALTSAKAEEELAQRGKSYEKAEVDALAATYILEDYFASPQAQQPGADSNG